MRRLRFDYEVRAVVRLSADEIARLSKLCGLHYDASVRALTEPGPGAVLNGARNDLMFAAEAEVVVTHRQLDTLLKATEVRYPSYAGDQALHDALRAVLKQVADEDTRLLEEAKGAS